MRKSILRQEHESRDQEVLRVLHNRINAHLLPVAGSLGGTDITETDVLGALRNAYASTGETSNEDGLSDQETRAW